MTGPDEAQAMTGLTPGTDYAARAAAGAAFLDRQAPRWTAGVDLELLALNDKCGCVLGQLYGDYWEARWLLGLTGHAAARLGFTLTLGDPPSAFTELEAAWASEISKRREPAQVTP